MLMPPPWQRESETHHPGTRRFRQSLTLDTARKGEVARAVQHSSRPAPKRDRELIHLKFAGTPREVRAVAG